MSGKGASGPVSQRDVQAYRRTTERREVITPAGLRCRIEIEAPIDDRCWRLQNLWAYVDDRTVGYLRTSRIARDLHEVEYPTELEFLRQRMGYTRGTSLEDLKACGGGHRALARARERWESERAMAGRPWVDFVYVTGDETTGPRAVDFAEGEYRRRGIGTALYVVAAAQVREAGQRLHSSTLRSREARAVWSSLERLTAPRLTLRPACLRADEDGERLALDLPPLSALPDPLAIARARTNEERPSARASPPARGR